MTRILAITALALAAVASSGPVEAKGCLKGAAVGGIAGRAAGHGVLGAAAGCVIGRNKAKKQAQQAPNPNPTSRLAANGSGPAPRNPC